MTEPSDLLSGTPAGTYDLTGIVGGRSVTERPSALRFEVADRDDRSKRIPLHGPGAGPVSARAAR